MEIPTIAELSAAEAAFDLSPTGSETTFKLRENIVNSTCATPILSFMLYGAELDCVLAVGVLIGLQIAEARANAAKDQPSAAI
jgi:sorbitol-specific phosphotransferase system component IIBC